MKKCRLILVLFSLLLLSGCKQERPYESFILREDFCIETGGAACFVYKPETCQLFYSHDTRCFRAGTDTMSDFYEVTVNTIPAFVGQTVQGSVSWACASSTGNRKNITLEAMRVEGDKIWLWSSQAQLGVVVQFFD